MSMPKRTLLPVRSKRMEHLKSRRSSRLTLLAAAVLVCIGVEARDRLGPDQWLDRMTGTVASAEYRGTVIRRQNGEAQALKVIRKFIDGVVNERVVTQEGNGLEIIRVGNEVHCILPDKKSVLIERWNNQSTLFSALPASDVGDGDVYDVSVVREERVAGRRAILIAIRPHDEFRFGHRLWLDDETAFPLRKELVDNDNQLIEQLKFAEIDIGPGIPSEALKPSVNLDNFTWYTEPVRDAAADVDTEWASTDLPVGFNALSARQENLTGAAAPVTHIIYSDGLANVSVFVSKTRDKALAKQANIGASSSYSLEQDGHQVTAVGEVPAATVRRIATSMRKVAP